MQVITSKVLNADTNQTMYPVDVRKPIVIDLSAVNNGVAVIPIALAVICQMPNGFQYTDNKVNVVIKEYGKSWVTGKCGWTTLFHM